MSTATHTHKRPSLATALRYEWLNLTTLRSTWLLLGAALAFQLLHLLLESGDDSLTGMDIFSSGLSVTTLIGGALVAAIGVNAFGAEYRTRTIATTVLTAQSRPRVVLAKAGVVTALALFAGLLTVGSTLVGSALLGGFAAEETQQMVRAALGTLAYLVLTGLVGLTVAGITRHAVLALSLVIIWPTALEGLAASFLRLPDVLAPFLTAGQLTRPFSEPLWYAPLPLLVLVLVLLTANTLVLSRRDV